VISIIKTTAIASSWCTTTTTSIQAIQERRWYVRFACILIGLRSSDGWKVDPDPQINTPVECNPTAIISTTTFKTTNVSVAAPHFANHGIIERRSEHSGHLILTVKRYVHLAYCSVPVPFLFNCLVPLGPAFGILFSLVPYSPNHH